MSTDGKGKGRTDGPVNMKGDGKSEAELRGQHVVVPPGAEAQSISCPICKESLKSEFLEDDEEWVWRNAVKKDDKVWLHFLSKFGCSTTITDISCHMSCRSARFYE